MELVIDYKPGMDGSGPSPKQIEAHSSSQLITMFGGAEYGGKTLWMARECERIMLAYPGIEGLMARFDYSDLASPTQARDVFYATMPRELIEKDYNSPPAWCKLKNGSRITFAGLKDYKPSSEYGFIAVDQAEEVPETTLRLLIGRIRQVLPDGTKPHYRMLLTCNPHPNIEWFLQECKNHPEVFKFIVSLPQDNPTFTPEFLEQRKVAYTDDQFRRLMLGSWDVFSGQALPEFSRIIHEVEPFDLWKTEQWPVYRGIDWGLSAPTVCLWLTRSPDGDMFFVQEYEQAGESPENNARAIAAMSADMVVAGSWIDPRTAQVRDNRAKKKKDEDNNWSVFKEFQRRGVYCQLATGKRENRLAAWKRALKVDPTRRHYLTHNTGAPQLYIFNTCDRLLYELPRMKYKNCLNGFDDDVVKQEDHAYDAGGFVLSHVLDKLNVANLIQYRGKMMIGKR